MSENASINTLTESERAVLRHAFRYGAVTQAQVSTLTGLTQQSASRIVSGLYSRGLLVEGERIATGRRGYPSASFGLRPDAAYAYGVSLAENAVTVSLSNFAGDIISEVFLPIATTSRDGVFEHIGGTLEAMREQHLADDDNLAGIGVAVSGSHIGEGQGYNTPYALEDWAGVDIGKLFADRFGVPAWADNDGNLAAFAEAMSGIGKRENSFAYLFIGSGVGGGVILEGELWRGLHGNAGEFAGGLPPNIYPFPNLELLRRLVVAQGVDVPTVHDLVERFDPSWRAIDEWIARVRDSVSIIASNATAILDVRLIVLGGQIPTRLAEMLIPRIELFDQRRRATARPMATIAPAEAPGNAAALGAAMLPLQQTYFLK
jgi:predicted NBD/HSP70 family sugar kinase